MRYRAPVLADAPAVLAVFEARELADLGEVDQPSMSRSTSGAAAISTSSETPSSSGSPARL